MKKLMNNKKAFTLLEVMLATAILLVVSLMVVQGFVSTMSYSANTAVYAKNGANNTGIAYKKIADSKGKAPKADIGATITMSDGDICDEAFTADIIKVVPATTGDATAKYAENSDFVTNRFCLTYTLPVGIHCGVCGSSDNIARDANDSPDYRWFCSTCKAYIGTT